MPTYAICLKTNQDDSLIHYGVKGMRWGVRRYQNEDGTLTKKGEKYFGVNGNVSASKAKRIMNKLDRESIRTFGSALYRNEEAAYYKQRADRKAAKGKDVTKLIMKMESRRIDSEKLSNISNKSYDFIKKISDQQIAKGRSVNSKDIYRYGGYTLSPTRGGLGTTQHLVGTKYDVKDDNLGKRKHINRYNKASRLITTYYPMFY